MAMTCFAACTFTSIASTEADQGQDIFVAVTAPDLGWKIRIMDVYRVGDELWVISQLSRHPGPAGQAITQVTDTIRLAAPALPVRHYILGKTWNWDNKEPYIFLTSRDDISGKLETGTCLYTARAGDDT